MKISAAPDVQHNGDLRNMGTKSLQRGRGEATERGRARPAVAVTHGLDADDDGDDGDGGVQTRDGTPDAERSEVGGQASLVNASRRRLRSASPANEPDCRRVEGAPWQRLGGSR